MINKIDGIRTNHVAFKSSVKQNEIYSLQQATKISLRTDNNGKQNPSFKSFNTGYRLFVGGLLAVPIGIVLGCTLSSYCLLLSVVGGLAIWGSTKFGRAHA